MATSKGSLLNAKDVVDMLGLPWPYQGFGPGRIPTPMPVGYRRARRGTIEAKVRPLDAARSAARTLSPECEVATGDDQPDTGSTKLRRRR